MTNIVNELRNIDAKVKEYFDSQAAIENELLNKAICYSLDGGKSVRAALVYTTGIEAGFDESLLLAPALAVELIHTYSLVHDDLPAMDNDDMRRGKPSNHIEFGEATAILVGDALLTLAFEILAKSEVHTDTQKVNMILALSKAAGANGMIAGQSLDMQSEGKEVSEEQLRSIHNKKTGALISASVSLGLLAGGHTNQEDYYNLEQFSNNIGLAFQVHDDILDVTRTSEELGKPANSDVDREKATFPSIVGLNKAKDLLQKHIDIALSSLDKVSFKTHGLTELANFIIKRDN